MKALYMSVRQAVAFVLAFVLSTGVLAQSAPIAPPRNSTVIRVGQVLDLRSGTYVKGAAIYVEGERIKAVGPATDVLMQAPTTARIIDLGDATVLPGLIDCHTHLLARIPDDK
jgi:imidazolonepropionase-like amidohydrolase